MRIVSREEFLSMPTGTVFMIFPNQPDEETGVYILDYQVVSIKNETFGQNYLTTELLTGFKGNETFRDEVDTIRSMLSGKSSPTLDYERVTRGAYYEDEKLFLVWERQDLEAMIACLQKSLASGYPNS